MTAESHAPVTVQDPVTIVVRHSIRPGKEAEFEDWQHGINAAALKFPGHLGFHVFRPSNPQRPEYLVFFRFQSLADLERWEQSEVRREWLSRLDPLITHPAHRERHSGLEVWFTPPPGQTAPPRWKMALVTLMTIYPLIMLVQTLAGPAMTNWPIWLRSLISAGLLVSLMTYLAMPFSTRLFAGWLYGRRAPHPVNLKQEEL